ncbi:hypothetical protein BGZ98_008231 [Dissophora globulifera]|nr:hypothetical protein BGZ98_008231 [Dissophora globulifera]
MSSFDFLDSLSKLNFIGVVSLFGGEIALSALRYSVLIRSTSQSLYLSMVVSPGLQTVSLKMFRRMEDRVSKAMSGGIEDDKRDIIGLSASGKYEYIGLHSGTKMKVGSILGEALAKASVEFKDVESTRSGPQRRGLQLKVMKLGRLSEEVNRGIRMEADGGLSGIRAAILYIIPLITVVGVVVAVLDKDYGACALIILNVICNMAVTFTVRSYGVSYPSGNASPGSPPGDALIQNADGTEMCLILADENTLQYLFQKPLVVPPAPDDKLWNTLHLFAAYSSYLMVIVNIIVIPFSDIVGQLTFGILMFFGVVQNLTLSILDGNELLLRSMRRLFIIEPAEGYTFQTRSSAIAYCMLRSKSTDIRQLKYLLPDTMTFGAWGDKVIEKVKTLRDSKESVNNGIIAALMENLDRDLNDAVTELECSGELSAVQ